MSEKYTEILKTAFDLCGKNQTKKALQILNICNPATEEVLLFKGMILEKLHKYTEAQKLYLKAFELNAEYVKDVYYVKNFGLDEFVVTVNEAIKFGNLNFKDCFKEFRGIGG